MARSTVFLRGMRLPPRSPSLAVTTIAAAGVHDPVAKGLGAEAAEDDGVHRADPRAGEHRVGEGRDHGHVDADPVSLPDAVAQQHVGHPADVVLQLPVGDVLVRPDLVLGPDDGRLLAEGPQVPVDAVEAGVQPAPRVPREVHLVVVGVEDRLPRMEPGEGLRLLAPEPLGVVQGEAVEPLVLLQAPDVGAGGDVRLHGIQALGQGAPPSRVRRPILSRLQSTDEHGQARPHRRRPRADPGAHPQHPRGREERARSRSVEAGTGMECLKAADSKGPFDLILLDVNLPDMDGFEVCTAIRRVDKQVPDRVRDRQGRAQGLRRRPRGGRRLLPREAHRPRLAALDGRPVHERQPAGSARRRPSPRTPRDPAAGRPSPATSPSSTRTSSGARTWRGCSAPAATASRSRSAAAGSSRAWSSGSPDLFIVSLAYPRPLGAQRPPRRAPGPRRRPPRPGAPRPLRPRRPDRGRRGHPRAHRRRGAATSGSARLLRMQADRRLLQRKVQELLGLYKISWAFSLAGGADALYGHLARQSAEVLRAEKGARARSSTPSAGRWWRSTTASASPGSRSPRARYSVDGEARSRWNFRKNGPLMSNKAQADSRLLPEIAAELGLQSVLVAPMNRGPQVHGLLARGRPGAGRAPSPRRT